MFHRSGARMGVLEHSAMKRCRVAAAGAVFVSALAFGDSGALTLTESFDGAALSSTLWSSSAECGSVSETGGELVLVHDGCVGGTALAMAAPAYSLSGDFDVFVDFALEGFDQPNAGARFGGLQLRTVSTDGFFATIERYTQNDANCCCTGGAAANYKAFGRTSANCDNTVQWVQSVDTSGRFRVFRTGSNVTCQYWSGSAWIQLLNSDVGSEDVWVHLYTGTDQVVSAHTVRFDNLSITADVVTEVLDGVASVSWGFAKRAFNDDRRE